MRLKKTRYRDGTGKHARLLDPLAPSWVSVEERTDEDLLALIRVLAARIRYYDETNQIAGDWRPFFDGTTAAEAARFLDDPERVAEDARALLEHPHQTLLHAFIRLLRHPRAQFDALTLRHRDFFYRSVLGLRERPAVPDSVHCLFTPAPGVDTVLLERGSLLDAGPDATDETIHYALDEDLLVTRARVTALKTLGVNRVFIDPRSHHTAHGRTDTDFQTMLESVVGSPEPGDPLPRFPGNAEDDTRVDKPFLNTLYSRIADLAETAIDAGDTAYILDHLFFASIDDFRFAMSCQERHNNAADPNVAPVTSAEWDRVYAAMDVCYRKRLNKIRRDTLIDVRVRDGFTVLLRYCLGQPAAGDPLPPFPAGCARIEDVAARLGESAVDRYVVDQLFLSLEDFDKLMGLSGEASPSAGDWAEVARILEPAWARARGYVYPDAGEELITGFRARDVRVDEDGSRTEGFPAFGEDEETGPGTHEAELGFAVSSPVLDLAEGTREIDLIAALDPERLDKDALIRFSSAIGAPLVMEVSGAKGWLGADRSRFEVGDFFLADPLQTYNRGNIHLRASAEANTFTTGHVNSIVVLPDGHIYTLTQIINEKQAAVSAAGRLDEAAPGRYDALTLSGTNTPLTGLSFTDLDDVAMPDPLWRYNGLLKVVATSNVFDQEHVGSVLVWSNGVVHEIVEVVHERQARVRFHGKLPYSGSTALYPSLSISETPDPLPAILLDGVLLANGPTLTPADVGRLILWENGLLVRIAATVTDSLGQVERVTQTAVEGAISRYEAYAVVSDALRLSLDLLADDPAVVTAREAGVDLDLDVPVARVRMPALEDETGRPVSPYAMLAGLSLTQAVVTARVSGLSEPILHGGGFPLDAKEPFTPFGSAPSGGEIFSLTHRELAGKHIDTLTLEIDWKGLPADLATAYRAYVTTGVWDAVSNTDFTVTCLRREGPRVETVATGMPLFTVENGTLQTRHSLEIRGFTTRPVPPLPDHAPSDPKAWPRCYQLELEAPGFGHDRFGEVIEKTVAGTPAGELPPHVPNPYTPEVKRIGLGYRARGTWGGRESTPTAERLFALHPFGLAEVAPEVEKAALVPEMEGSGYLYIGLEDSVPGERLSLLVQMVEGSGNPDKPADAPTWDYMCADRWERLAESGMIGDTTGGLLSTGLLRLEIPSKASIGGLLMPGNRAWLRARVTGARDAFSRILAIDAQAVRATFSDRGNDPERLTRPLPAGTIQAMVDAPAGLGEVRQPYSSFGARVAENADHFAVRVSERLRHKQRALTAHDIERLVLARFPEIYKAKCLDQTLADRDPSAGSVRVVVVPDIAERAPFFPLEPKAPLATLARIRDALSELIPPTMTVTVHNPRYEQIRYRVVVTLNPSCDAGYFLHRLGEDLKRFLSPWAYVAGADIPFCSRLSNATLVHYIEKLDYVDHIDRLVLVSHKTTDDAGNPVDYPVLNAGLAEVRNPDGILVSAEDHILEIAGEVMETARYEGIDYMIVEVDFVVG